MLKRLGLAAAGLAVAVAALAAANPRWVEPVAWFARSMRAEALAAEPAEGETPLPRLYLDDARVDPSAQVAHVTARLEPAVSPTTTVLAEVFTRNGEATLPNFRRLVVFRAGDPPVQSVAIPLAGVSRRDPGAWFEVLADIGNPGTQDNRILARVTFTPGAANRETPFKPRPEAQPRKGALAYELDVKAFRATSDGGKGVARTRYGYGRWPEGDIGYYTDPVLHPGTRSWEVRGDELVLRAEKFPRPLTFEVLGKPKTFDYGSSVLEWPWLAQKYGYYEVEAMTSGARGTWSAFWLLPADNTWPPEIDIFEHPRNGQVTANRTTFANHWTDVRGAHRSVGGEADLSRLLGRPVDATREFHTYGVDWRADFTTYYVDGREVWRTPTRFHKAAFPILDVAIAGKWAGQPDLSTGTSEMRVRAMRIWR